MKAHKYWSVGALITMIGTFYTGYKGSKSSHRYFACSALICMIMSMYTGHKMISGNKRTRKQVKKTEAYQKIKDEFGFDPVRMDYLPQNMQFEEEIIYSEMQNIQMIYSGEENTSLRYEVNINYNEGSIGVDREDQAIAKSTIEVKGSNIEIKSYKVNDKTQRIVAAFEYGNIQYFITGNGMEEEEFKKIIKNLHFF